MSATKPMRRGACPGLTTPMATGDGLLVRLMPVGTISLDAMAGLCAAAQQHGNGILEITSRGSLQVRGLSNRKGGLFTSPLWILGNYVTRAVPRACTEKSTIKTSSARKITSSSECPVAARWWR